MKKSMKNFLLMGAVTLAAGVFTACSDSDSGSAPVNTGYVPVTLADGMNSRTLSGIVTDATGNALSGVAVTSGSETAKTNSVGMFTLSKVQVKGNRIIVGFEKEGYVSVTRACDTYKTENWNITLIGKNEAGRATTTTLPAASGGTVAVGKMKVDLPAGGFKVEGGAAYSGTVNVEMAFVSPDEKDFADMMPGGDLRAVRAGGDDAELLSYGMVAVSLTGTSGQKLNLADGKTANVSFPIPESLKDKTPATIPLWSFNETTGKWEEDGEAKLVGDHYEGTVKHFSWWNLDYPSEQGIVEGVVTDKSGKAVANINVHVGQRVTTTNAYGYYRQAVPAGEDFEVTVRPEDYGDVGGATITVKALEPYETRKVDLTLNTVYKITGRLLNGTTPLIGALQLSYGSKTRPAIINNSDGTFTIYAPQSYTGPAQLNITTGAGRKTVDITLAKADVNLGDINFTTTPSAKNSITVVPPDSKVASFVIELPELFAEIGHDGSILIQAPHKEDHDWDGESEGLNMFFVELRPSEKAGVYTAFAEFMGLFGGYFFDSSRYDCTGEVVKIEGDKLIFTISGTGNLDRRDGSGDYSGTCTYASGQLTATITSKYEVMFDVMPREVGFPSFTPQLSTKAPYAVLQTMSAGTYGKGGRVCYNGTAADVENLKAQVKAAGLPEYTNTDGLPATYLNHTTGEYEIDPNLYRYYKDGKYVQIRYNPSAEAFDYSVLKTSPFQGLTPQISIYAYDNVAEDAINGWGDWVYESAKKRK